MVMSFGIKKILAKGKTDHPTTQKLTFSSQMSGMK